MNFQLIKEKSLQLLDRLGVPLRYLWSLLFTLILIRILEYFAFSAYDPSVRFVYYLHGIQYDFVFVSFIAAVVLPLSLVIPSRASRVRAVVLSSIVLLVAFSTWFLSEYYQTTLIPLDHSLLIYPLGDIIHIASSSATIAFGQIIKGVTIVALSILLPLVLVNRLRSTARSNLLALAPFIVFLLFVNSITPNIRQYDSNQAFYQIINKTSYCLKQVILNVQSRARYLESDVYGIATSYHDVRPDFEHLGPQYPFMRRNTDADVLSEFFDLDEGKPNIVFIIVESLSRTFSGPDARWGSFTPFLDSLRQHSLYWRNFLATSERTFSILPSSLASLPYGSKGFMALAEDGAYPAFRSLNGILHKEGYKTSFYYGGWSHFDFMGVFLKEVGVSYILNDRGFGSQYSKIQSNKDGFTWGYPDHAVFQRSLEIIDSLPHQPRIDIYLTLSTHDPFFPPLPEHWEEVFFQHLDSQNFSAKEREFFEHRKLHFSTVLYTDDAIRQLFDGLKERPGYENTIFLIYGDHHMPMHDFNPIEKYHVPFMVYSPMLSEAQEFPAISSAADITPTILGMMRDVYSVSTPEWIHWLGSPLDTSSCFRSNRFVPFMRVNRDIDELLWGDLFLSEGRLYRIDSSLAITPYSNRQALDSLEGLLYSFNVLNDYVCTMNAIRAPEISSFE